MFIDTHAHLESKVFDNDRDDVIKNAFGNGVERIINIGYDKRSAAFTMKLIDEYKNVFGAVGMHPHDAKVYDEDFEDKLMGWLKHDKILALGEIGLDYFKEYSPKEKQIEVFERQLEIAKEFNKPVVIHCREAWEDTYRILKKHNISNGVMHCFSEGVSQAECVIDMGMFISFTGTVTFRKSDLKVVKSIPLSRLLLETDCPYMTPHPHRGKRNEPKFIPVIAEKISRVKEVELDELERITTENAYKLFKGLV